MFTGIKEPLPTPLRGVTKVTIIESSVLLARINNTAPFAIDTLLVSSVVMSPTWRAEDTRRGRGILADGHERLRATLRATTTTFLIGDGCGLFGGPGRVCSASALLG